MTTRNSFYIVWSPTGPTPPRHRHDDFDSADREAKRLARVHPGNEFFVMGAVRSAKVNDLIVTNYHVIDDLIPF